MHQSDSNELRKLSAIVNGDAGGFTESSEEISRLDYHGISALVCENNPTHKFADALTQRKPLMVANEALRAKELNQLFCALHDAGLSRFLVFKGTALAYSTYPKPWLRPRTDTDILIDKSDIKAFNRVFKHQGYERQFGMTGEWVSYQCTYGKRLVGDATINIDVHWRINNRQCLANSFELSELLQGGRTLQALHSDTRIPSCGDSLIIACLHRLGHHHTEERLAWLYDIHLLALSLNSSDWEQFLQKTIAKRLCGLCLDGLNKATDYFATSVPDTVLSSLSKEANNNEPSAIFLNRRLSNWQIFQSDLNAIHSYQDKISFMLETAFPTPDYVRQQMGTKSAPKAYLIRAAQGIKRLLQ